MKQKKARNVKPTIVENVNNLLVKADTNKKVKDCIPNTIIKMHKNHLSALQEIVGNIQEQKVHYVESYEKKINLSCITFIQTYGTSVRPNNPVYFSDSFERKLRELRKDRDWKTKEGNMNYYLQYPVRTMIADIILYICKDTNGNENTVDNHIKMYEQLIKNKTHSARGKYQDIKKEIKKPTIKFLESIKNIYELVKEELSS